MKLKSEPAVDVSGFLDKDTEMRGDIVFRETLHVDGKFQGSIRGGKRLVVGEDAVVNADIEVKALFVRGQVKGKIRAYERVDLQRTSRVTSDLASPVLVIEEGAWFEGTCSMEAGKPALAAGPKPLPLKGA